MKWERIETAPKDGTPILGYWPTLNLYRVRIGSWDTRGFWALWNGGVHFSKRNPPTHWMLLPDPPEAA